MKARINECLLLIHPVNKLLNDKISSWSYFLFLPRYLYLFVNMHFHVLFLNIHNLDRRRILFLNMHFHVLFINIHNHDRRRILFVNMQICWYIPIQYPKVSCCFRKWFFFFFFFLKVNFVSCCLMPHVFLYTHLI